MDSLTGCLSRGAFLERLEHEAKRTRRHHSIFSLIVADVDNLKSLNDSSGHRLRRSGAAAAGQHAVPGGPGERRRGASGR